MLPKLERSTQDYFLQEEVINFTKRKQRKTMVSLERNKKEPPQFMMPLRYHSVETEPSINCEDEVNLEPYITARTKKNTPNSKGATSLRSLP
jgi:hypothetical protein